MTLWGSSVDASLARPYTLIDTTESPFPPVAQGPNDDSSPTTSTSSEITSTLTSSRRPKPTDNLPGDHGTAEGEADKPAFSDIVAPTLSMTSAPSVTTSLSSPTDVETFTPDEGWFSDMSNLVYNQAWLFGAVGLVVLFGISAGLYLWRRRVKQKRNGGKYNSLTAEDLPMGSTDRNGRGARTRELYDAFGEVSDDDDADEETRLRGPSPRPSSSTGLGFHSAFLDDDEHPNTAATPMYKDEPDEKKRLHESETEVEDDGVKSPASGSGSGDGSWEHASDTR